MDWRLYGDHGLVVRHPQVAMNPVLNRRVTTNYPVC